MENEQRPYEQRRGNYRLDIADRFFGDSGGEVFVISGEVKSIEREARAWIVVSGNCKQRGKDEPRFNLYLPLMSFEFPIAMEDPAAENSTSALIKMLHGNIPLLRKLAQTGGLSDIQWPQWLRGAQLSEVKQDDAFYSLSAADAKRMRMQATRDRFEMLRLEMARFHAISHFDAEFGRDPLDLDTLEKEAAFAKVYVILRSFGVKNLHGNVAELLKFDEKTFGVSELSVLSGKLKRQGLIPQ